MENKTFKVYSDDGHGWIAVKKKDLESLGIIPLISDYSYFKGETFYLEEDRDAGIFIQAFEAKFCVKPKMQHKRHNGISPIRSYRRLGEY